MSGTMANKGAWTNIPIAKGKVTIPAGYHNGSGYVDTTSVYDVGYNAGKTYLDDSYTIKVCIHHTPGNSGGMLTGSYERVYLQKNGVDIALLFENTITSTSHKEEKIITFTEHIN